MSDSPARIHPNRTPTGDTTLDALLAELRDADTALEERVTARHRIHQGRYVTFEQDSVITSGGSESTRDLVVHPGAVVIVPVDPDGSLLLVTQYRLACGGAMLELPAGTLEVEDGVVEDPLGAAHRELEEETGYRAGTMKRITGFWTAPGFSTEYLTLYLATDLRPAGEGRLSPDADENLRLSRISWRDAMSAIESGIIEDAKSVAGILLAARELAPTSD
ncbi:MAG TPA: NUDIX hydrolase [Candidatus Limnocylindrales bacterium]